MEPARPRIRKAAFVPHPPLQDTPWAEISPERRGRSLVKGVFVADPPLRQTAENEVLLHERTLTSRPPNRPKPVTGVCLHRHAYSHKESHVSAQHSPRAQRDLRRLPVRHPAANRRLISRTPSLGCLETKAPGEPWDNDFFRSARHPEGMADLTSRIRCAYAFAYCHHDENIENHFQFKTRADSQYSVHNCFSLAHSPHNLSTRMFT